MAARVRAARGYADLRQPVLAHVLATSTETYGRIEAGTRPPSVDDLDRLAAATGVPRAFFDQGFAAAGDAEGRDVESRLAALEAQVRLLSRRVGTGAPAPPADLGRRAGDSSPTAGSPDASDSDPEAGSQRDSAE